MRHCLWIVALLVAGCTMKPASGPVDVGQGFESQALHAPWSGMDSDTRFCCHSTADRFFFQFDAADSTLTLVEPFTGERDVDPEDRVEFFFAQDRKLSKPYYCAEIDSEGRVMDYKATFYRAFDFGWNFMTLQVRSMTTPWGYRVAGSIAREELESLGLDLDGGFWMGVFQGDAAVGRGGFSWGRVIGDPFLPDTPVNIFLRGEENDADIIMGNTADEFRFSPGVADEAALEAYARRRYPACAEEYMAFARKDAKTIEEMRANVTYNSFEMGNVLWLEHNLRHPRHKIYFYRFDPEIPGWDDPGAFHSSDLWFAFESLAKCWRPFTGKHYDLARQMCNYWTNFARSGDPNGSDADGTPMETWKPYTEDSRTVMFFGDRPEQIPVEENEFFRFLQKNCEEGNIPFRALNAFDQDKEFDAWASQFPKGEKPEDA